MVLPVAAAPAAAVAAVAVATALGGVYRVPEGHVAVTFRGGALIKSIRKPGFHTAIPVLDRVTMIGLPFATRKAVSSCLIVVRTSCVPSILRQVA